MANKQAGSPTNHKHYLVTSCLSSLQHDFCVQNGDYLYWTWFLCQLDDINMSSSIRHI